MDELARGWNEGPRGLLLGVWERKVIMDVISNCDQALLPVNKPDCGFYCAGKFVLSFKEVNIENWDIITAEKGVD